ncbi:MAG TPA: Gfo/Idh/MocA family oxidoreductase, partial [Pyrinomonadaceae bacterium]|nr:Gfo/Idh/MocA family oxidoreductase [Pyrinomonadaceae bacterium]
MGKIRVAVVGTGFGRYGLIPAFGLDPRCEVVAVCSTSRARAAEVAESLGVPSAYGDFWEMFESADFDAVAVATPPAAQEEIVGLALARAKAVFTEKPFALSVGAARRLKEEAD